MDYKFLIKLIVPEIEKTYELYIPINRSVKDVCMMINRMINEDTAGVFPIKDNLVLCNKYISGFYSYESFIRDTDIRNGSQLVLF